MNVKSAIYTIFLAGLLLPLLLNCKKETTKTVPTVTIAAVTNITASMATSGGDITSDGGTTVTSRGVCWSTNQSPTISDGITTNGSGTGIFTSSLIGLTPGTTYNIKAYATNSVGTAYSGQLSFITLALAPVLTTADLSAVTSTTAACGGNITNDGGSPVTSRGVCWNTTTAPTIVSSKTSDGTGSGSFTSAITGLLPGTTYYFRAYATNSIGTAYGNEKIAAAAAILPVLTTAAISALTSTTATSGGNITSDGGATITARGVCWSTTTTPTIANSKTSDAEGSGVFTSSVTGLTPGTTYYIRAYATNRIGTAYGNEVTVAATSILPVLTTSAISALTSTTAISGGNITSDGGAVVTTRGVCWSTSANPTTASSKISDAAGGSGSFTSSITGLTPGTTYYFRAYAMNSKGTSYGNQVITTTNTLSGTLPVITTVAVTAITTTTAKSGGNISSNGSASVTSRGVCWSTNQNPTITNTKTSDGTSTGSFTSSITGLTPGTTYYFRAYATNSVGTAYGNQITAITNTTTATLPIITTTTPSTITATTALSGGNISSDGGAAIIVRGVCWSKSPNPTKTDSISSNGIGSGSFTSSITGLTPGTIYYFRAFATNSIGTSYGNQLTATTLTALASVSTTVISSITSITCTGGGNVISDGGAAVTVRGVCYGTSQNPTITNTKTNDGTSKGSFTSSITGLLPGTTYYFRAYATNSVGTSYGGQVTATTNTLNTTLPVITTTTASAITATSATSGGNITSEGGAKVTVRGICWSKSQNPTKADTITSNGTGSGNFISTITGLTPNTTYYIRAFATNSIGTAYGNQITVITNAALPDVYSMPITAITAISVTSGGSVGKDGGAVVTTRGVCYSISQNPIITNNKTTNGSGLGSFTSNITGLTPHTTYYFRAYATNSIGTAYGSQMTTTTNTLTAAVPLITTSPITALKSTSATGGGNITSDGGALLTARGVCWSKSQNPTTSNFKTYDGLVSGIFVSSITGLTPGTTYYFRAYATNNIGTAYGSQITATTPLNLGITTIASSAITASTITSGGNVTSDGGYLITARGVCWSNSQNPTTANSKTTNGTGSGTFTSSIIGLRPGATYYIRAYVTNSKDTTVYGNQVVTKTLAALPTITTATTKSITAITATSGGNITSDGGATVSARGVCWSTTQTPTIGNFKTTDGSGINTFTSSLTGLTANTTYYVRAYATNSVNTAYGNEVLFKTSVSGGDNGIIFNPSLTYGTLTDIDGNVYKTIVIGTQTWMAENLKTTKYRNGDPIPLVTDSSAWGALTTPAYCWYNNDAVTYKATYGALYNWSVVDAESNGGKNVCPAGWHVPTASEWGALISYSGGVARAGGKLKETGTTHWLTPNTGATNETGFTALPGGARYGGVSSSDVGIYGCWLSSTEGPTTELASGQFMNYSMAFVGFSNYNKNAVGISIRCVKD